MHLVGAIIALSLACIVPTPVPTPTPAPPTPTPVPIALVNGGFEADCTPGGNVWPITGQTHDNICTPDGWVTWWQTGVAEGGELGQPEVKPVFGDDPIRGYGAELPRLHSGHRGLLFFTMWRPHHGGFYQRVDGLRSGAVVRVTAWAHAWTCTDNVVPGYSCVHEWDDISFSIGLEPDGDCYPKSDSIIWSERVTSPDFFSEIQSEEVIVGEDGSVCVLLSSRAKWGFEHLDSHWDDVVLEVKSGGVWTVALTMED